MTSAAMIGSDDALHSEAAQGVLQRLLEMPTRRARVVGAGAGREPALGGEDDPVAHV